MQPFLPWPGSKAKCAAEIVSEFPRSCRTYYEPFLGSGAVYFALNGKLGFLKVDFQSAALSDVNAKLINCWQAVKDKPEHVKRMLAHCLERNSEEFYGQMRDQMDKPSIFIYVMRAAFSSMYRVNLNGRFNVPWRKLDFAVKKKRISYDVDHLGLCSSYLNRRPVTLAAQEWNEAVESAQEGDLVYFDPPYLPYNGTGFVSYDASGFGVGDHVMLVTYARRLMNRGVFVAISNSDTPDSRRIYGDPHKLLSVTNAVKSTATSKGKRSEGLWIFKP